VGGYAFWGIQNDIFFLKNCSGNTARYNASRPTVMTNQYKY
jgi:hypothetical protein